MIKSSVEFNNTEYHNTTIQLKHASSAEFTSANPILAKGEMGVETDTDKFKFGDGETVWNALAYAGGGGAGSRLYGQYSLSGNQSTNLGLNQRVLLDTKLSGALPNPVNGVITLPAGKTFKLQYITSVNFTTSIASAVFRFYNITDQVAFGSQAQSVSITYSTNAESMNPSAIGYISTTKPTEIEMRITAQTALANIYGVFTTLVIEEV